MGLLTSRLSRLRDDPRLLRLPPYLALLCMLGGIAWMLLLPLDEYSRRTYISENALLPGQVHTYFHGSEQNVFRGYRHEVASVLEPSAVNDEQGQPTGQYLIATDSHRTDRIEEIFQNAGIKTARQTYSYESSGKTYTGENVYAIVHGPRADGTESVVLVAPIRNIENQLNTNGVTLLLTLARYFSRWSLWSKDIILLVTPDTASGPQAWVDAYHSTHDPSKVADLSLKSGHIQGAVVIDYPFEHHFETLHVAYDGINGQLPNLDLINTAVQIASGQMGIGTTIQSQHTYTKPEHQGDYLVRLRTLVRGMASQALGHSTGAHSVFMPYHIDAITLTAVGHGWQDEMAFGRSVESITRSLNNLLEKLHQSFFFYLLLQNTRFVSIGTYLPSAMAFGASFTIVAIWRWISGGYEELDAEIPDELGSNTDSKQDDKDNVETKSPSEAKGKAPRSKLQRWKPIDRSLVLPITFLATIHLIWIPMIFLPANLFGNEFYTFAIRTLVLVQMPFSVTLGLQKFSLLSRQFHSTKTALSSSGEKSTSATPVAKSIPQTTASDHAAHISQIYTLLSSLSLLILGLELTVLATLNFSLSIILGLVCSPLAFIDYSRIPQSSGSTKSSTPLQVSRASTLTTILLYINPVILTILSPPILTFVVATVEIYYVSSYRAPIGIIGRVREYLQAEAFAFDIWGSWGSLLGMWAIWAPAWVVGMVVSLGSLVASKGKATGLQNDDVRKEKILVTVTRQQQQQQVKTDPGRRK